MTATHIKQGWNLKTEHRAKKFLYTLFTMVMVISLGACASSPFRGSRSPEPAQPSVVNEPTGEGSPSVGSSSRTGPGASTTKPAASASRQDSPGPTSRRGAYYMDDGPGNEPAPDHRNIPNAQPKREPLLARANRPYVVFGRSYQPMTALVPYRQRGYASWYGRKFHGQKTASGEVYNMYSMTAAHPTLPLPSYVKVTNVRNGEQIIVRVNDRGPFLNDRLIDLSYTAASKLGYVNAGSAEVEVELIAFQDTDIGNSTLASAQDTNAVGKSAKATSAVDIASPSGAPPAASTSIVSPGPSVAPSPGAVTIAANTSNSGTTPITGASSNPGASSIQTTSPSAVRKEEVREERLQVEVTVKPDESGAAKINPDSDISSNTKPNSNVSTNSTSSTSSNSNSNSNSNSSGKNSAGVNAVTDSNRPTSAAVPASAVVPAVAAVTPQVAAPTLAAPAPLAVDRGQASRGASRTYLQLGAFSALESAESVRAKVRKELEWIKHPIEIVNEAGLFKLRTGPFSNRDDANGVAEKIRVATGSRPFTTTR